MTEDDMPRFSNHLPSQTLTGLTLERLPRDGSLGRVRRYRKGANIWRPDDRADRIYFLKRGQVAMMTGDSEGNEVIMKVIAVGEPFGELCFCSQEKGLRHTTGRAVITFCERLSEMERRVEVLTHRGAEERLTGR